LRFLVDAQLPPALADYLRQLGHEAEHVNEIGSGAATDRAIWTYAKRHAAIIVTKDQDFADLTRLDTSGPPVVWIRLGNTTRAALLRSLQPLMPELLAALDRGERLIEIA
jgi:predicted nuclease of predicted toxin-antitoxin system